MTQNECIKLKKTALALYQPFSTLCDYHQPLKIHYQWTISCNKQNTSNKCLDLHSALTDANEPFAFLNRQIWKPY